MSQALWMPSKTSSTVTAAMAKSARVDIAGQQDRRDEQHRVGDERGDRVPQPVFQDGVIGGDTEQAPRDDADVDQAADAHQAEGDGDLRQRRPRGAEERGDEQRDSEMHHCRRGEGRDAIRGARPQPSDEGDHHEHQAGQRRRGAADDDIEVFPRGQRRHSRLLLCGMSDALPPATRPAQ